MPMYSTFFFTASYKNKSILAIMRSMFFIAFNLINKVLEKIIRAAPKDSQ